MRELEPLWSALRRPVAGDALVTLVAKEGSGYRRPGARLLVHHEGHHRGLVSGGCLEEDLADWARGLAAPATRVVDTTGQGDAWFGTGLGCAGRLTFLGEPLAGALPALELARSAEDARVKVVIAVAVDGRAGVQPGTRGAVAGDGRVAGALPAAVLDRATRLASDAAPVPDRAPTPEEGWFLEVRDLVPRLVVAARAADWPPLRDIARAAGWEVEVLGASPEEGEGPAPARPAGAVVPPRLPLDRRTALVVMTHRFESDLAALRRLDVERAGHVAVLGPPARTRRLLEELGSTDPERSRHLAERLVSPAGLPLGGHGPGPVALSLFAEAHRALVP